MSFADQAATLQYHQGMLADDDRVEGYRDAIREVVRPGDVAVDLGTGTGLLAYLACQAGASRVYAIDRGPVLRLAAELSRANGFRDRVVLIPGESTQVNLPELADVLLSETLWNFGLGEGIVGTISDARERFLRPSGRVLPQTFEMMAAPIEAASVYTKIAAEPADRDGLDFSVLRAYARSNVFFPRLPAQGLLSEPRSIQRFDLDKPGPSDAMASVHFDIRQAGTLHGIAGWFSARLSPSVVLDNAPDPERSNWAQAFLPIDTPVDVNVGDRLETTVQTSGNGSIWRWKTRIHPASGGRAPYTSDQTTFFGFPPGRSGLANF